MVVRCNVMLKAEVLILTSPSFAILFFKIASLTESIAWKTTLSAASPDLWASLEEETISVRIKSLVSYNVYPYWTLFRFYCRKKIDLPLPPPDWHSAEGLSPPCITHSHLHTKFLAKNTNWAKLITWYVERKSNEIKQAIELLVVYARRVSRSLEQKKPSTKSWAGLAG